VERDPEWLVSCENNCGRCLSTTVLSDQFVELIPRVNRNVVPLTVIACLEVEEGEVQNQFLIAFKRINHCLTSPEIPLYSQLNYYSIIQVIASITFQLIMLYTKRLYIKGYSLFNNRFDPFLRPSGILIIQEQSRL